MGILKKYNYLLILLLMAITLGLWILSKENPLKYITDQPLMALSQAMALMGFVLMSVTLVLSTRIKVIEAIFGGLDKVYTLHAFLGGMAFLFIINHPLLLVLSYLPNTDLAYTYLFPSADLALNLGVYALYLMLLSFIFMVFIKLPYHIWIVTHQLLGLVFLLSGVHAFKLGSDLGSNTPLQYWMLGFTVLGFMAIAYVLIFYKKFGPRALYSIARMERKMDIITLYLRPVRSKLVHLPGQFAYFSFLDTPLGRESHPFTISSSPNDEQLRISVKILGDYTMRMRELNAGERVVVYGPYGCFYEPLLQASSDSLLWIGAGIGITPFLGMLRYVRDTAITKKILFYYIYKEEQDAAVFKKEIDELTAGIDNITVVYWCSSERGRFSLDKMGEELDGQSTSVQLCGPQPMMESITEQLVKRGINPEKITLESFGMA
jgi:predicted ferric reductase